MVQILDLSHCVKLAKTQAHAALWSLFAGQVWLISRFFAESTIAIAIVTGWSQPMDYSFQRYRYFRQFLYAHH